MRKICISLLLIFTMIFSSFSLSFAASDSDITLVNPVANSATTSSNLLISVKLTAPKTVKVSAYELRRSVANPSYVPGGKAPQYITQALGDSDMKAITDGKFDAKGISYPNIFVDNFSSNKKLSFYTKKLEKMSPGVYLVKVETIANGKSVYMTQSYVEVKEQQEDKMFSSNSTGAGGFLQGLVKSVFGN